MRFMCTHSVPPNTFSIEQLRQFARAAQNDPQVRGLRSFSNLSQGRIVCIMEAPDLQALGNWFRKMDLPFDFINPVEFEGEAGNIIEMTPIQPAQV